MKKLVAFTLACLCGFSFAIAQDFGANVWTKINCPVFSGLSSVTVSKDGRIFATSSSTCHVSNDKGLTWSSYNIAFDAEYIDQAVWFASKLYVGTEIGIISSPDGINWQLEKAGYGFPAICANDNYLFIFGHTNNSWRTEGSTWVQITQPSVVVSTACASNTILTAVCESGGPGQTQGTVYKSYNNGQSWNNTGTVPIQVQEVSANNDQYSAAGFNMSHTMQACGQYAYLYGPGDMRCVTYSNNLCLTGGSKQLTPTFYTGVILENGDTTSAAYFNGDIIGITANSDFAVADMLGFELYRRDFDLNLTTSDRKELAAVTIYPNPTSTGVNLMIEKPDIVSIFSPNGTLLYKQPAQSGKNYLDLSSYPPGMYFIQLGFTGARAKIVKQ